MKCSNCGKRIPFSGRVCPFCHAQKSGDKLRTVIAAIIALVIVLVIACYSRSGNLY